MDGQVIVCSTTPISTPCIDLLSRHPQSPPLILNQQWFNLSVHFVNIHFHLHSIYFQFIHVPCYITSVRVYSFSIAITLNLLFIPEFQLNDQIKSDIEKARRHLNEMVNILDISMVRAKAPMEGKIPDALVQFATQVHVFIISPIKFLHFVGMML